MAGMDKKNLAIGSAAQASQWPNRSSQSRQWCKPEPFPNVTNKRWPYHSNAITTAQGHSEVIDLAKDIAPPGSGAG